MRRIVEVVVVAALAAVSVHLLIFHDLRKRNRAIIKKSRDGRRKEKEIDIIMYCSEINGAK